MSNEYRLKAIKEIASESAGDNMPAAPASLDFYGEDVFNAEATHRSTRASRTKSRTP